MKCRQETLVPGVVYTAGSHRGPSGIFCYTYQTHLCTFVPPQCPLVSQIFIFLFHLSLCLGQQNQSLTGSFTWSQPATYAVSGVSKTNHPRLNDFLGFTGLQHIVVLVSMIYYSKGYKAQPAKGKSMWGEVQGLPRDLFRWDPTGLTQFL